VQGYALPALLKKRRAGGIVKGDGKRSKMSDINCDKCFHRCVIKEGARGFCDVRENRGGREALPLYSYVTSVALDPVEKKPLCHFNPGSTVLSVGFAGCNLRCPFCQNYRISQSTDCAGNFVPPDSLLETVKKTPFPQIAYTYSEPLVHPEYLLACASLMRENGVANILVTNGTASREVAVEVLKYIDAVNVDLKCFDKDKYRNVLKGDLRTVLEFIESAVSAGVHTEITTLVVTDFNDDMNELKEIVDFIAGISADIPYHISAYHPDYKYHAPPTDKKLLFEAEKYAKEKLKYVHIGNIRGRQAGKN